ncbi:hypothetical protein [Kribbella ginsengisoli]|uniref:Uncharacterized protein n=1 Tax=Kribbella ginsengisoli TaxID=363865 RepID=A0ABP6Z692_9ACTN
MTRLAISGHRGMQAPTEELVAAEIHKLVQDEGSADLTGISCLADGPDSIFAEQVLEAGGRLIAVIPASKYRESLPDEHHQLYDSLLERASETVALEHTESDSEAHMDASLRMLELAEKLIAVWDGQPARGYGGTADVVSAANEKNIPVIIVWPPGSTRD